MVVCVLLGIGNGNGEKDKVAAIIKVEREGRKADVRG